MVAVDYMVSNVVGNPFVGVLPDKTQRIPTLRQAVFLCDRMNAVREVLYGGAAGGGKSDALLMAALQYVHVPGYSALILRKSFADLALPGAIMDRAHSWLTGTGAKWNGDTKTWTFPSGATITFGYLQTDKDKYRYQGSEFQFIAFDELTQFLEEDYQYMFSRLRRLKGSDVPIRMRSASNPGGIGHLWVKNRFLVSPWNQDTGQRRIFVKSTLKDNPYLDQDEYVESLMELGALERARLLDGDWDAEALGNKFRREWVELVQRHQVPWDELRCVRFWDLAATDPEPGKKPDWSVGALVGFHDITHYWYLLDVVRMQGSPGKVKQRMRQVAEADGFQVPIRVEQETGGAGKWAVEALDEHFLEYDFSGRRPTGNKEVRFNPVSVRMEPEEGATYGKFKVLMAPWNEVCFNELELFPNTEHDDQADAISGAYMELARGGGGLMVQNYIEGYSEPVYEVGDLRFVGDQYIDKD